MGLAYRNCEISWDSVPDAVEYKVWIDNVAHQTFNTTLSCDETNKLSAYPSGTHSISVVALNKFGESPSSSVLDITINKAYCFEPEPPAAIFAANLLGDGFLLTWDRDYATHYPDGYLVRLQDLTTGGDITLPNNIGTTPNLLIGNKLEIPYLSPEHSYSLSVQASRCDEISPPTTKDITTPSCKDDLIAVTVTPSTEYSSGDHLDWSNRWIKPSGFEFEGFVIERYRSEDQIWLEPVTTFNTQYDFEYGGDIQYVVRPKFTCFDRNAYLALSGWITFDQDTSTTQIEADGNDLYKLTNNGGVWQYSLGGQGEWQLLDNNPATIAISASAGNLYQLHNNGRLWVYTGTPMTGWQMLDYNPATIAIESGGDQLYQLHDTGRIWRFTGDPITGWELLSEDTNTIALEASNNELYQLHSNGEILRYTGTPISGWQLLDNNLATIAISADSGNLYQLHSTGAIWRFTGTPITGWQNLDNNSATIALEANGGDLYQLHNTGVIWRYTGVPFSGWQALNEGSSGSTVKQINAGNYLYKLESSGALSRWY